MKVKFAHNGDIRTRTKFLFIPKTVNKELRWLEHATWQEFYSDYYSRWIGERWIDS
jgi:hypothetical protein